MPEPDPDSGPDSGPASDPDSGLARFRAAQDRIWPAPLEELRAGRKTSHWMWFVLPQLRGLGRSPAAVFYGIGDAAEARAYLADPVLRRRLLDCAAALLGHRNRAAADILGPVDALKLRSSATLFARAAGGTDPAAAAAMRAILDAFFDGRPCPETLARLG